MDRQHYFKDVRDLDTIDVYQVLKLFGVTHPALQHAIKKDLCSGIRGAKGKRQDRIEALESKLRYFEMEYEAGGEGAAQEFMDLLKHLESWVMQHLHAIKVQRVKSDDERQTVAAQFAGTLTEDVFHQSKYHLDESGYIRPGINYLNQKKAQAHRLVGVYGLPNSFMDLLVQAGRPEQMEVMAKELQSYVKRGTTPPIGESDDRS